MKKITKNDYLVDFLTSNKYTPEDRQNHTMQQKLKIRKYIH